MAIAHKSAISINVIYVPVDLYKTTRDTSISFNQLCKDTHERVKYKKICPSCNKEVTSDDIIKGYEYQKGSYITFTPDELERIKSEKDKTLHIESFAKMSEIDPIYYDQNYYLIPAPGAEKSYELLRQALLSQKKVAVAKTVLTTKEELLVLYPTKDVIVGKMLFYQEEIQPIPKTIPKVELTKQELDLTKSLIEAMTQKFDIAVYYDEYQQKLRAAIASKIAGNEIVSVQESVPNNIIDLVEALQTSLNMAKNKSNKA
ncbi:Ku protein [Clostridium sp. HBUAS56010]|uniref:non-homologous end joining protein Ku n=1 Tax=Clostridium sp. HBUAS56010 TaxID=2571127 RepID=UPI00117822FF|nr:Ku protein [Clostridium sp. HBUAS56010]